MNAFLHIRRGLASPLLLNLGTVCGMFQPLLRLFPLRQQYDRLLNLFECQGCAPFAAVRHLRLNHAHVGLYSGPPSVCYNIISQVVFRCQLKVTCVILYIKKSSFHVITLFVELFLVKRSVFAGVAGLGCNKHAAMVAVMTVASDISQTGSIRTVTFNFPAMHAVNTIVFRRIRQV